MKEKNKFYNLLVCLLLSVLTACGGSGSGGSGDGGDSGGSGGGVVVTDTTPDPFSFDSVTDAAPNSIVTSNYVTIQGIEAPAEITISGSAAEYQINGEAYTSNAGTIQNGDGVRIRLTASPEAATTRTVTLTVGGVSAEFSVTTTRWQGARLIENDDSGDALEPKVGADQNGNAVVIWRQYDGTYYSLWSARYDGGSDSWEAPSLLETANGHVYESSLAVDRNGNAIVVWTQEQSDFSIDLWYNRYDMATRSWKGPTLLGSDTTGKAEAPTIAVDDGGNAIVVWAQRNMTGGPQFIQSRRYVATSKIWRDIELRENMGSSANPHIAMNGSGNALVAWAQSDGSAQNIYVSRYNAAGNSWSERELAESDSGYAAYPRAALSAAGQETVAWQLKTTCSDCYQIVSSQRDASSGIWSTPVSLQVDPSQSGANVQLAVDPSGDVIALWSENNQGIWVDRFDASLNSWGGARKISSATSTDTRPRLAIDENGNILVTFNEGSGMWLNAVSVRYDALSGSWGAPVVIDSEDLGHTDDTDVAFDGRNNGFVVWAQKDGTRYNIWSNRYIGE